MLNNLLRRIGQTEPVRRVLSRLHTVISRIGEHYAGELPSQGRYPFLRPGDF